MMRLLWSPPQWTALAYNTHFYALACELGINLAPGLSLLRAHMLQELKAMPLMQDKETKLHAYTAELPSTGGLPQIVSGRVMPLGNNQVVWAINGCNTMMNTFRKAIASDGLKKRKAEGESSSSDYQNVAMSAPTTSQYLHGTGPKGVASPVVPLDNLTGGLNNGTTYSVQNLQDVYQLASVAATLGQTEESLLASMQESPGLQEILNRKFSIENSSRPAVHVPVTGPPVAHRTPGQESPSLGPLTWMEFTPETVAQQIV